MTRCRLVGTASSVARGIDLPANDIDVLFRDRDAVDAWCNALESVGEVETAPAWLDEASQYFARLVVDGITVELSTVEVDVPHDTAECAGAGAWVHFDVISCGGTTIEAVASELRLITEVARLRPDRYRPIVSFLRTRSCDRDLVRRGLADLGVIDTVADQIVAELRGSD